MKNTSKLKCDKICTTHGIYNTIFIRGVQHIFLVYVNWWKIVYLMDEN